MPDDMREIVTVEQVQRWFLILAIAMPALGMSLGAWLRRLDRKRGALIGLAWGMLGPFNLLLWYVYNRITGVFGLDSVKNLFINLILFVALGAIVGFVAGRISNQSPATEKASNEDGIATQ